MFKQLKRKTLILNLSMLTILLLAVFTTLYLTNYNQIHSQIEFDLSKVMSNYRESFPQDNPLPPDNEVVDPNLPERSVSFIIVTNLDGDLENWWYSFTVEDDSLLAALDDATSDSGTIKVNDSYWAYKREVRIDSIVYGFIDITSEQTYLSNMIWSFVGVFAGAFVIVYFFSNFFSNQSIKKIKEAFNKQKQFIANASHEIKTPLAIISTNTDILLKDENNNKWLNNIKYETERMSKLTKDLLYLTKMSEESPKEIVLSKANLSELVESSMLSFEALAYNKDIHMTYDITPDISTLIDTNQMSQVIHILMDNAIKYTNESGEIKVDLELYHNQITYTIMNSGDGIKKEDIPNVFDRFYMGDKSRSLNEKSFGLGLSIAKTIIENHHGKIYCESEEGKFTKFIIKLKQINTN